MSLQFRDLTANEIDVRIGQIKSDYIVLLLYKDARCDMAILDEKVGPENWERDHYECKGNLFCRVGINRNWDKQVEYRDMVYKSDCGTESNTEKEKGEASDSFKRACVNWGIGRELYTAPFIYVKLNDDEGQPNYKISDKGKVSDKFIVEKISIENKRITGLTIRNKNLNKQVFVYGKSQQKEKPKEKTEEKPTKDNLETLKALAQEKGVKEAQLLKKYKIKDFSEMTMSDYLACTKGLQGMETK